MTWFGWIWGSTDQIEEARKNGVLIGRNISGLVSVDILENSRSSLRHVDPPEEYVDDIRSPILAPTADLSQIKKSWLGITTDILADAISRLRPLPPKENPIIKHLSPAEKILAEILKTTRVA